MNPTEEAIERVRIRVLPDERVSRRDAAKFLGHSEKTLANWALKNFGPKVIRVGGKCFYHFPELQEFAGSKAA